MNTKMIHRRTNSYDKFFSIRNVVLGVSVATALLVLLYTPARNAVTQAVFVVAPGIWKSDGTAIEVKDSFWAVFRTKQSLVEENSYLLSELSRMQAQVLDRNLLAEKVAKLDEALGRAHGDNRVVAEVIAGPRQAAYDTLIIDAGREQGVTVGDEVVYAGSGLVGTVVEVFDSLSKIKLYSTPEEDHLVLAGEDRLPVVAVGRGMGNFTAKVPQGSGLKIGDNIISLEGGFILGTVSFVEEKPAEPFDRIFFRVPFNVAEMHSVEVVKTKQ